MQSVLKRTRDRLTFSMNLFHFTSSDMNSATLSNIVFATERIMTHILSRGALKVPHAAKVSP
jgi:hypothetical protein